MQSFYGLACTGSPMAQCYHMFARPSVWCDWKADCLSWSRTVSLGVKKSDPVQHALMHALCIRLSGLTVSLHWQTLPGRPFNRRNCERPHPGWLFPLKKSWKMKVSLKKVLKAYGYCNVLWHSWGERQQGMLPDVQKLARKQEMLKRLRWQKYVKLRG